MTTDQKSEKLYNEMTDRDPTVCATGLNKFSENKRYTLVCTPTVRNIEILIFVFICKRKV
jgi:hypothetical protein